MMSICVENEQTGQLMVFAKGASDSISDCADPKTLRADVELKDLFTTATSWASEGLRTLAFSCKKVSEEEVRDGSQELIEKNLHVLGITGVEDLLQNDVADCVQDFISAGIKVWMLTGDKGETALQIGLSCGIYTKDTSMRRIEDARDDKISQIPCQEF